MKNVMVDEYYLKKGALESVLENYGVVAAELFADAVAVGAIVLPDGVGVDDFQFRTTPFSDDHPDDPEVHVIFRGDAQKEVDLNGSPYDVIGMDMMSSEYVSEHLSFIAQQVQALLFM
jgi:hypothetical protein